MSLVLTILAQPAGGDSKVVSDDGNLAVIETKEMMANAIASRKLEYEAVLERATYVQDIALILDRYKREKIEPDIIQVLGHSSPGRLQLGEYWSSSAADPARGPTVLDSSPHSYGLLDQLISDNTRILLLGCYVGAAAPRGYIASGRALMFDIEDMTGASVYAADNLVRPTDFEDDFLFRGSLVMSNGKGANPAFLMRQKRLREPKLDSLSPSALHPQRIISAPAFGFDEPLDNGDSLLKKFFGDFVRLPNPPRSLFAMTEMVLETRHGFGEVIAGMRYVRVHAGDKTLFFGDSKGMRMAEGASSLDIRNAYLLQRSQKVSPSVARGPSGTLDSQDAAERQDERVVPPKRRPLPRPSPSRVPKKGRLRR